MMKTKKYLLFIFLFLVTLPACEDLVEEEAFDFLAPQDFYKTEEDAGAAVTAAYSVLASGRLNRGDKREIVDQPGEMTTIGAGDHGRFYDRFELTPGMTHILFLWQTSYIGINIANVAINRIPAIDMDPELRERYVAEARFIRAMIYFNLIRIWGNVPLVVNETTDLSDTDHTNVGTGEAVWQQIIEDLEFAEDILDVSYTGRDVGRATRGAAKGLLAKVYLQRSGIARFNPSPSFWGVDAGVNEWQLAADKAKEVIDMGIYDLFEDYSHVFHVDHENGIEHLFSIQYDGSIDGQSTGWMDLQFGAPADGAEPEFYDLWDPADKRLATTFITEFTNNSGVTKSYPDDIDLFPVPLIGKFQGGVNTIPERSGVDNPVLRYSDILLVHSEAVNEISGPGADAVSGINMVRERAGLAILDPADFSQETLRDAILQERSFELCFEANALFDYQRHGILEEKLAFYGWDHFFDPFEYVMPIPVREVEVNPNIRQNEGYQ